jgi:excisionase family DNA binding protein
VLIAVQGMKPAPRRSLLTFSEQLAAADPGGQYLLAPTRPTGSPRSARSAPPTPASNCAGQPERPLRPSDEEYLTVAEVAQILRFTDRHVRKLIDEGEIEAHHFGSAVRVTRASLDNYIERCRGRRKAK